MTDAESRLLSTAGSRSSDIGFSEAKIDFVLSSTHIENDKVMPFIGMLDYPESNRYSQSNYKQHYEEQTQSLVSRYAQNTERSNQKSERSVSNKSPKYMPKLSTEGRQMPWDCNLKEAAQLKLLDDIKRRHQRNNAIEQKSLSRNYQPSSAIFVNYC